MRRRIPHLAAVMMVPAALLAATAALALAAGTGTTAAKKAHLRLVKRSPLTIRGLDFPARVRVTVTLTSAATTKRRPTTDRTGSFSVVFGTAVDRCTQWVVTATRRGAAPVRLRGPRPMCAPAGGYGGY